MDNPSVTLQAGTKPDSLATANSTAQEVAEMIVRLLNEQGGSMYGGEQVTQVEHALQCAALAQRSGASTALVVAALLHDVGHLLQASPSVPRTGVDDLHEELAAHWLAVRFGPEVVEPVRLHVAAKRFLCATDPVYFGRLSLPSQQSLKLQGGPMSTSEVGKFLAHPHYRDAVLLRRWDDEAKIVGKETRAVEYYTAAIAECVNSYRFDR